METTRRWPVNEICAKLARISWAYNPLGWQTESNMKKNIGAWDRLIRAVLGTALIYYALSNLPGSDVWRVPVGIAGIVAWFTVLTSWCPLYKMLGLSTHPRGKTWSFLQ